MTSWAWSSVMVPLCFARAVIAEQALAKMSPKGSVRRFRSYAACLPRPAQTR